MPPHHPRTPNFAPAPSLAQISEAERRLRGHLSPSPLVPLCDDTAKAEYALPTGSFKVRGALVAMSRLAERGSLTGVVAASAGNHGLGVAFAAKLLGLPATVVIPPDCPPVKADRMRPNCEVRVGVAPGYDAAEAEARQLADSRGAVFLSPFDDTWVMAGNGGTLALEILSQAPDVGTIVVPVGGGGLLSGLLAVLGALDRDVTVVAVESEASPAFSSSLREGHCCERWPPATTLAEGLEGGAGPRSVLMALAAGVIALTVSEPAIARAMIDLTDALGTPIEGSAAVVEAARRSGLLASFPRPLVGILTGGNVSGDTIEQLRGLYYR